MNEIVKKNGIQYGVITGIISVLITAGIYAIDLNLFTSMWLGIGLIVFYMVMGVVVISSAKKQLNGNITFKEAFTTYFISAIIGIFISVAFNIILFNFIDPGAKETIKELIIKSTAQMMEKFGAKSSDINEALKKMQDTDQFSIGELAKGSIFNILFSSIYGLILAAIMKTKSPNRE